MRKIIFTIPLLIMMGCTMDRLGVSVDVKSPYRGDKASTKSISVTEITNGISSNTIIGKGYGGAICRYIEELRWGGNPFVGDIFGDIVREELENNGYNILGKAHSPFKDEYKKESEYLLGGKLIEIKTNLCRYKEFNKGEVYIKVAWEIYDKKEKKIVFATTTEGYKENLEFNNLGDKHMFDVAFRIASKNLLADKRFYELMISNQVLAGPKTKG
jgi:hypothetical protein